jgi:dimethylamine--corrinoid protein Co-methyltransferase
MEGTHELAAGMCGVKTSGDLVMRMQLAKGMRLNEAKEYVAEKLGVSVLDLHDSAVMEEVRKNLKIGSLVPVTGEPSGIEVKYKIAEVLGITINSVEKSKEMLGIG